MYPIGRLVKELFVHRSSKKLDLFEVHTSSHLCWPWDLDPWMELNNGRTLTVYDLGRLPMIARLGFLGPLKRLGWGLTVAGASVRYRRRVRMFQRIVMHSNLVGWDRRFLYFQQNLWLEAQCANHLVVRMAITDTRQGGIVPPEKFMDHWQSGVQSPELPDWIQKWIIAEDSRPWPPSIGNVFKVDNA